MLKVGMESHRHDRMLQVFTLLPLVFDSLVNECSFALYDCVSTIENKAPKCYPVMKVLVAIGICFYISSTDLGHGDASMMFQNTLLKKNSNHTWN